MAEFSSHKMFLNLSYGSIFLLGTHNHRSLKLYVSKKSFFYETPKDIIKTGNYYLKEKY